MKPNWKDSPEWAEWLAMDSDGTWYWYEYKPSVLGGGWHGDWPAWASREDFPAEVGDWRETLEHRPEVQP